MNQAPPADDSLDELLSDFFKAQMKQPWPPAPAAPTAVPQRPAAHDPGNRARYTLAASVALFVGTCWALSSGFQPGERTRGPASNGVDMNSLGASDPDALKELRRNNAEKGNVGNDAFDPNRTEPLFK